MAAPSPRSRSGRSSLRGRCLCGGVRFAIADALPRYDRHVERAEHLLVSLRRSDRSARR